VRHSIRRQLPLSYVLVAAGPLLLVGIVLTVQSFTAQFQQAISKQTEVARRVVSDVDAFFERLEGELRIGAAEVASRFARNQQAAALAQLPSYPEVFDTLILVNAQGQEVIHLSRLDIVTAADQIDWSGREEFTFPRTAGRPYYGSVNIDPDTGQPSINISVPVVNVYTGAVNQVLVATLRFKRIWDLVAAVDLDAGENIFITDNQNRIVAHLNPSIVLQGETYAVPSEPGFNAGQSAQTVVVAWQRVNSLNGQFQVVAERNVINALALAIQTAIVTVFVLLAAIALAAVTGYRAAQRVVIPIEKLVTAAKALQMKSEAFDKAQLSDLAKQDDEFGQLGASFVAMGQEVQAREQNLKQEVQELRIEIDEVKRSRAVQEITDSEFFKELQTKAMKMRTRTKERLASDSEGTAGNIATGASTP